MILWVRVEGAAERDGPGRKGDSSLGEGMSKGQLMPGPQEERKEKVGPTHCLEPTVQPLCILGQLWSDKWAVSSAGLQAMRCLLSAP